jgi:uncharacterized protein YndB with AHSA1/START domain
MSHSHFEVSETINASPANVYEVLTDYLVSHPAILPKPYFSKLVVEQGGHGAGTVFELHMDVYGTKRVLHPVVSEPEPGRVLVETDADAGVVTTFTVDPLGEGSQSRVTFATDSRTSPGLQGFMERLFQPMVLRRIYKKELQLLAQYVQRGL